MDDLPKKIPQISPRSVHGSVGSPLFSFDTHHAGRAGPSKENPMRKHVATVLTIAAAAATAILVAAPEVWFI